MADWPSTPGPQDFQNLVDDVHHGLRHRGIIGEADAIAHVLAQARAAGVAEDVVREMATEQFRQLLDGHPLRPRRWRSWPSPPRRTAFGGEGGRPRQLPASD